jgi:hypothetical protein
LLLQRVSKRELPPIAVAQRQLKYLRELDADQSGETENSDVHSALSGLCALTDLACEEGFEFSEVARTSLLRINEDAMLVMRERADGPHARAKALGNPQEEAAVAVYDAILMNVPGLAAGETTGQAFALSKALYQTIVEHCGERPGFDAASSVICVQDYRAMLLAGRPTMKL